MNNNSNLIIYQYIKLSKTNIKENIIDENMLLMKLDDIGIIREVWNFLSVRDITNLFLVSRDFRLFIRQVNKTIPQNMIKLSSDSKLNKEFNLRDQ